MVGCPSTTKSTTETHTTNSSPAQTNTETPSTDFSTTGTTTETSTNNSLTTDSTTKAPATYSSTTEFTTETLTTNASTAETSSKTSASTQTTAETPATIGLSTVETTTKTSMASLPTTEPIAVTLTSAFQVQMSFAILENFTTELNDSTSQKYKTYKHDIETSLSESYSQKVIGFIGVNVERFREGSVITDFLMDTDYLNSSQILAANIQVAQDLNSKGYNVVPDSFQAVLDGTEPFTRNPSTVYVGNNMTLTCNPPSTVSSFSGQWAFNNIQLPNIGRYSTSNRPTTLTVTSVTTADSGMYTCLMKDTVLRYTRQEVITIQPVPSINLDRSRINVYCDTMLNEALKCCVTYSSDIKFTVQWQNAAGSVLSTTRDNTEPNTKCITFMLNVAPTSCSNAQTYTCLVNYGGQNTKADATVSFFTNAVSCKDPPYGQGEEGSEAAIGCQMNYEGNIIAVCKKGIWINKTNNCVLNVIKELQVQSQMLTEELLPVFANQLANVTIINENAIQESPATIFAVVEILNNIANVSSNISMLVMKDILATVNVLVAPGTNNSWKTLNNDTEKANTSASLLGSMETITGSLSQDSFTINTAFISLRKTVFTQTYNEDLNSSHILISDPGFPSATITTVVFTTMDIVLPARNSSES
ncbi:adhesion G protein-coupled receptor F5-like, partial [Arapaima gigas]